MDEISLFTLVRPDAADLGDADRAAVRQRLLAAAATEQSASRPAPARRRRRRVWLPAVAAAAAVAVAAAVAAWPGHHGAGARPASAMPQRLDMHALAFTTSGGYITVIVQNPLADQSSYNAEFRAHHLDITLLLVPVSPSLVGTVDQIEGTDLNQIKVITAQGRCQTGDLDPCPVGLRVPLGFRGQATLVFGRAARPGEQYDEAAQANAPGEVMYGLAYQGKTVAAVLAMLQARHVTVPTYRDPYVLSPSQVPGTWYVYDALAWAPQQVVLWVGPTPASPTYSP
jgi:hypothetical protein